MEDQQDQQKKQLGSTPTENVSIAEISDKIQNKFAFESLEAIEEVEPSVSE